MLRLRNTSNRPVPNRKAPSLFPNPQFSSLTSEERRFCRIPSRGVDRRHEDCYGWGASTEAHAEDPRTRRGFFGQPSHIEPELSGIGKEHIVRIAPVQSFLRVGFWASTQTTIRSRFTVDEGRLPPASSRPGHVVVRQDRVLWSFRVVHLQLSGGNRLGTPADSVLPPAEPINRDWPSDALPKVPEPDLQPNSCDCRTDIQWVDDGLFDVLV